jgi:RNA polymerase sigma-70 factor (ECF subfamily)
MESYAKQSYEPEKLHVTCSGRSGLNGEPYSLANNDLVIQNILISAYNEPVTESELSKAIGIPAAYIEPIVQKLVDNELMKRTGNKVYTDFIIFTNLL